MFLASTSCGWGPVAGAVARMISMGASKRNGPLKPDLAAKRVDWPGELAEAAATMAG